MRKALPLQIPFYIGLSVIFLSILFRIQHWPGGIAMFWVGFSCYILFFIMMFVEMFGSKKANSNTKVFWALPYIAVLLSSLFIFPEYGVVVFVVLGIIYFLLGRKQFLYKSGENEPIRFDSI